MNTTRHSQSPSASPSTRSSSSKTPLPALRLLTPPEDSAATRRAPVSATDARTGDQFFFTADQVSSIEPTRDGCILRLRRGRWVILKMSSADASKLIWGAPSSAAA